MFEERNDLDYHAGTLAENKKVNISSNDNCIDGKKLSTTDLLSMQSKNPNSDEKHLSGTHLTLAADCVPTNQFPLRPFGCGTCNDMFETENQFMEHCNAHYCDALQKDTFLELFEMHLISYFPETPRK